MFCRFLTIEPHNFKATRGRPSFRMGKFIEYYIMSGKECANSTLREPIKVLKDTFPHEPYFHSFLCNFCLFPSPLSHVANTEMPEETLGLSAPPVCPHSTLKFLTAAP